MSAPVELVDDAAAYQLLERLRWGDGAPRSCPHCSAHGRTYLLRAADGQSRRTRTGSRSQRRVWKCGACRRQFSVLTGTVLEGTRVSVLTWVAVLTDVTGPAGAPELPAAGVVVHRYGVSPQAARQLLARLQMAFATGVASAWQPERLRAPDQDG